MSVSERHLALLRPYLAGETPGEDGELDLHCPLHEDVKRSARINVEKGMWYCHAGCGGGDLRGLIRRRAEWVDPPAPGSTPSNASERPLEANAVATYTTALLEQEWVLEELLSLRGLTTDTVIRYGLGWDAKQQAYTIPVYDSAGELVNIRFYQPRPADDRRKIWGLKGHNRPAPYPLSILADGPEYLIICEGEFDALVTIQHGFPAITRTGSATTWNTAWHPYFRDRVVYLCHDCDETGQDGNRKVGRALTGVAAEVRVLRLPYPILPKHGKDLTDFWMEGGTPEQFQALLDEAQLFDPEAAAPRVLDPADSTILDAFDARLVGQPLRLVLTIRGKSEPGSTVSREARLECTRDFGAACAHCPLNEAGGLDEIEVAAANPIILELLRSHEQNRKRLLAHYGAPAKCTKVRLDVRSRHAVEILYGRPSIDHLNGHRTDEFKQIKLTSVGRHDTGSNTTVQVVGALYPNPDNQLNEFLVWEVTRMETSIDAFELDAAALRLLRRFRPRGKQRPLEKLREITDQLAAHVTRIYGRPHMHAVMDLTWHSVIGFNFLGEPEPRGWLESLIIGDTRTGKSAAAAKLCEHYRAGDIFSCEGASFAGLVGGAQQLGAGKEWSITWGVIPMNDRRLVVLDEVGELDHRIISEMSSMRSSGVAELTKIQQERAHARTRLLWMGNPKGTAMRFFLYGVHSLQPVIGKDEDVARFDLATSVSSSDVAPEDINVVPRTGSLTYTAAACSALVRWVWSRRPDQVVWEEGAEQAVLEEALRLGALYIEEPPLIQAANVRVKIARVACALAARLWSTPPDNPELLLVTVDHVRDAARFMDALYSQPGFGYRIVSNERKADLQEAAEHREDTIDLLRNTLGLGDFLRRNRKFRPQDLEHFVQLTRELAAQTLSKLSVWKMVRMVDGFVLKEPELNSILTEESV